jgi:hypothetical protein
MSVRKTRKTIVAMANVYASNMKSLIRRALVCALALLMTLFMSTSVATAATAGVENYDDLVNTFEQGVQPRLSIPENDVIRYGLLLIDTLLAANATIDKPQIVMVVDRDPKVQALLVFLVDFERSPLLVGASPVSTGKIGTFDHFETPTGVFVHSIDNLDYRAEGTKNSNGIRGYGLRGIRVYDFGWQQARKGWGDNGNATMRLQMHATDPDLLEPKLGTVQSKGCIRISASMNRFIDHYGLLDADYESALAHGASFWVLPDGRNPTPWSGRYLVVVDTARAGRPHWAHWTPARQLTQRAMPRGDHAERVSTAIVAAGGCVIKK